MNESMSDRRRFLALLFLAVGLWLAGLVVGLWLVGVESLGAEPGARIARTIGDSVAIPIPIDRAVYAIPVYVKDGKIYRWPHSGESTDESERLIVDTLNALYCVPVYMDEESGDLKEWPVN